MKLFLKNNLPHLLAVLSFILIGFIYCSPVLQGKVPYQSDVLQAGNGQSEIHKYQKPDGSTPLWTNSMFSGMPAFQIGGNLYKANLISHLSPILDLRLPIPVVFIYLFLTGAYILFISLEFDPLLAFAGALAIGFTTYNFSIIEAGHLTKCLCIAFFTPIIGGILISYKGKYIQGGLLTSFFMAWELRANHPQMTYYLFLSLFILFLTQIWIAYSSKAWSNFFKASLTIGLAVVLALGINISSLMVNSEYLKESTRGKTELTLNSSSPKDGLAKDYAYQWSEGISEIATFLVPNAAGGSSGGDLLDQNSETAKQLASHNAGLDDLSRLPVYWGAKPFTSSPFYAGAFIVFLFILGIVIVKNPIKWWLIGSTLLSILLSWGKNFQGFSDLFFDHIPFYNKFRAVETILVIADFCLPLLAFIALKEIIDKKENKKEYWSKIKFTFYGTGGLLLVFILVPSIFFTFVSPNEAEYKFPDWLLTALHSDRASLLKADAFRSLVFISLGVGLLWGFLENKLKKSYIYILFGLLILIDLWGVDKRFFNDKNFVEKVERDNANPPNAADLEILRDSSLGYRVFDASSGSPFSDARASSFHRSIGGYSAAKLKRYEELIEFQLSKNNMQAFNMLNTKYFIVADSGKRPVAKLNPMACGNAWFVNSVEFENTADQEMNDLTGFDPKEKAIVNRSFQNQINILKMNFDTSSKVKLFSYRPDDLQYTYTAKVPGIIVFSEIYYPYGWKAFIDGKPCNFFRADYVLRAMQVPEGKHTIEFKFESNTYLNGEKISGISSIIMAILIILSLYYYLKSYLNGEKRLGTDLLQSSFNSKSITYPSNFETEKESLKIKEASTNQKSFHKTKESISNSNFKKQNNKPPKRP